MARIRIKELKLKNKPADCATIRIYIATSQLLDYNTPYKDLSGDKNSVLIPTDIPGDWQDLDYYLGVSYLDAYGNESNIKELLDPFDFTPPPTPEVEVIDSGWISL